MNILRIEFETSQQFCDFRGFCEQSLTAENGRKWAGSQTETSWRFKKIGVC